MPVPLPVPGFINPETGIKHKIRARAGARARGGVGVNTFNR